MNADAFRHFYEYHLSENHKVWEHAAHLTPEQFTQDVKYSHGSVRDQIVHLMDCEDVWFSELQGVEPAEPAAAVEGDDRDVLRVRWDGIEQKLRRYLAGLRDEMLSTTPIQEPEEDRDLIVWQVLLHVANHATDHRAQLLRVLNDLGLQTGYQDYIFHVYEHRFK